ncbi:MAG: hypothetical protein GXX95_01290 [Methanomassiliicoccus sp.]|nr:hypothetical protein [Methanomassiliicoccus sp.]
MQEEIQYEPNSAQEGAVYVYRGGIGFIPRQIDSDVVLEVLRNHLIVKSKTKLKRLVFRDKYKLNVTNPQGEPDEELAEYMQRMFDSPRVALWSKMMMAFNDIIDWGPALYNPVWAKEGNEWVLKALRHLPPESFSVQAPVAKHEFSELLPGIVLDEDTGEVQFWQSLDMTSRPFLVRNVYMVKDPTCSQMAGESQVAVLVGLIREYNFCRKVQMQQCNRIGAGNIFIKFTNKPSKDDIAWANAILENWGNNTAFSLKANMEVDGIDVTETKVAIMTIEELKQEIDDFFSPSSMIKRQEGTLGSTGNAENDATDAYILGWHSILEQAFQPLVQTYLDVNGFEDYRAEIDIPAPKKDRANIMLQQAKIASDTGVALINEVREKLELPPLDDKGKQELLAEKELFHPAPPALVPPNAEEAEGEEEIENKEPDRSEERKRTLEGDIGDAYTRLADDIYARLAARDGQ